MKPTTAPELRHEDFEALLQAHRGIVFKLVNAKEGHDGTERARELKTLWQQTERRLERMEPTLRLNERLARAGALEGIRSRMRFTHLVLWYELAFGVRVALFVGSCLVDHFEAMRFALPAAAPHLGAILTIGVAAWQLVALGQVDYGSPGH